MSITMEETNAALQVDLGRLRQATDALRKHLASRAATAPVPEQEQLLPLISALDNFGTARVAPSPPPQIMTRAPARPAKDVKMSSIRQYLYNKTAYAPAPVFHLAGGLGRALRFLGL